MNRLKHESSVLFLALILALIAVYTPGGECRPALAAGTGGPAAQGSAPGPDFAGYKAKPLDLESPDARGIWRQWKAVLDKHDPGPVFVFSSELMTVPVFRQWLNLSGRMPTAAPDAKLRYINGFFNKWSSKSDNDNYAVEEHWATPLEFLEKGFGDCEDYTIIKYFALRYFNWPADDLWIVLIDDHKNKDKHAVLAARFGERTFILDNLSRPDYLLIPQSDYFKRQTPLKALNESGVWTFDKE